MKIITWPNGEKAISHCSWQLNKTHCTDKDTTKEQLEKAAAAFNIKIISSTCCQACLRLLQQADDLKNV